MLYYVKYYKLFVILNFYCYICINNKNTYLLMTESDKKRFYILIGEAINTARNNKGYSQAILAERISMSRASIVNIEKGRQHPPIHLLYEFSKILEISIVDLLPKFEISNKESVALFEEQIKNKASEGIISAKSIESLNSFVSNKK